MVYGYNVVGGRLYSADDSRSIRHPTAQVYHKMFAYGSHVSRGCESVPACCIGL